MNDPPQLLGNETNCLQMAPEGSFDFGFDQARTSMKSERAAHVHIWPSPLWPISLQMGEPFIAKISVCHQIQSNLVETKLRHVAKIEFDKVKNKMIYEDRHHLPFVCITRSIRAPGRHCLLRSCRNALADRSHQIFPSYVLLPLTRIGRCSTARTQRQRRSSKTGSNILSKMQRGQLTITGCSTISVKCNTPSSWTYVDESGYPFICNGLFDF